MSVGRAEFILVGVDVCGVWGIVRMGVLGGGREGWVRLRIGCVRGWGCVWE